MWVLIVSQRSLSIEGVTFFFDKHNLWSLDGRVLKRQLMRGSLIYWSVGPWVGPLVGRSAHEIYSHPSPRMFDLWKSRWCEQEKKSGLNWLRSLGAFIDIRNSLNTTKSESKYLSGAFKTFLSWDWGKKGSMSFKQFEADITMAL